MLSIEDLAHLWSQRPRTDQVRNFSLRGESFHFESEPYLMGVINLSPDSWYRESVSLNFDHALQRARLLRAQGAHLIDLGAESTLAQARRVGVADQKKMLLPLIRQLAAEKFLVSVETYSLPLARAGLKAGAAVLNLTGTEATRDFFKAAVDHDAAVILCYVAGPNVRRVKDFDFSRDPIDLLNAYFERKVELAERAGLKNLWLDPGLGFYYRNLQDSAVRVRHQLRVFLNTFRLRKWGYPICHALPHAFEFFRDEVRSAEPFFSVLAALGQTSLYRTHEVARVRSVLESMKVWNSATVGKP